MSSNLFSNDNESLTSIANRALSAPVAPPISRRAAPRSYAYVGVMGDIKVAGPEPALF